MQARSAPGAPKIDQSHFATESFGSDSLAIEHLRATYPAERFVGTVPAVKPAAERTASGLVSVLATPGTVMRDYTRDLVQAFAAHCRVELVGSKNLARIAEDFMHGRPVSDEAIAAEIARCFVQDGARRTDEIVLACTHYPLLTAHFERLAPWPVEWIDPAPAIARRVEFVLREKAFEHTDERASDPQSTIVFTSGATPDPELSRVLAGFGLMAAKFAPISVENIRA